MFGKQVESSSAGARHSQSVLQDGVVVRGEFEAQGDVRLDGRLEGKVMISERLTVGAGGSVTGNVEAAEVTIMGNLEGTVTAHRRIELRKGARVVADLTAPSLVIEEGVYFHGNSNMSAEKKEIPTLMASKTGKHEKNARESESSEVLKEILR